jgi:hypothetical protein
MQIEGQSPLESLRRRRELAAGAVESEVAAVRSDVKTALVQGTPRLTGNAAKSWVVRGAEVVCTATYAEFVRFDPARARAILSDAPARIARAIGERS